MFPDILFTSLLVIVVNDSQNRLTDHLKGHLRKDKGEECTTREIRLDSNKNVQHRKKLDQ